MELEIVATKGERTRSHILNRAADLIAHKGLKRLTARSLANAAKVSPALVSHYFPDLSDMMFLVTEYIFETAPADRAEHKNADPLKKLEELVIRNFDFFRDHPSYYKCILLSYFHASFDERFQELHLKNFVQVRRKIIDLLKEITLERKIEIAQSQVNEVSRSIMELIEGALLFAALENRDGRSSKKRIIKAVFEIVDHMTSD